MSVLSESPPAAAPPATALDAALRAGALLMQSGASSESAMVATKQLAAALGQGSAGIVLTGDAIAGSGVSDGTPFTVMRPIPALGANLARAAEVHALADRAARDGLDAAAVNAELDRIGKLPAPWSKWVVAGALGVTAFAFNQLLGGPLSAAVAVLVATAVGYLVRGELTARKVPTAAGAFVAAALAAFIAAVAVRLGLAPSAVSTFIPAVTFLIPGFALTNGLLDLFSVKYVPAGIARIVVALLTFLLIGLGVAAGIALGGGGS